MPSRFANQNAVAAIRVSTEKQGRDGDSPEAQKEQIERYAETHGITIKQFFVFLESASKDQQPVQPAIDYCKNPKNGIQLFIIKSIDRFTRGGSHTYDELKMQLDQCKVKLVDIYGVISAEEINTLDHLGFEYKWSKFSPSKKSEILEAERAKDELRDIMSRIIGAEIRYTQLGFWMRRPPYGLQSEKIETKHGKRCILTAHPTESKFLLQMFELSAKGALSDDEIVEKVNSLGFCTRVKYKRDPNDRTNVLATTGGNKLTVKAMHKLIRNPIYAGINAEKWTNGQPIKCAFEGLISIELFNKANRGKRVIVEDAAGNVSIHNERPPEHLINKGTKVPEFAYRKFVLCPQCNNPLLGSFSRGKSGKRYPAYHCSHHGHYYRIPKQELEQRIMEFTRNLMVSEEHLDAVMEAVATEWNARNQSQLQELAGIDDRIRELKTDAMATVAKIRVLSSSTAIKFMEEDLMRIEQQIQDLTAEKARKEAAKPADINTILKRVRYFVAHLDKLVFEQDDPIRSARLFAILFNRMPTTEDLNCGTPKTPLYEGVNSVFEVIKTSMIPMVAPRGVEPRLAE